MTRIFLVLLAVCAVTVPAAADDYGRPSHSRAFWLNAPGWPNPQAQSDKRTVRQFTMTYTEGVARRFGVGSGRVDFFERRLGNSGPALAGTVDGGGARLVLRWHPGE